MPRSTISARAYKSDFLAQWDGSPDPLASLKQRLQSLHDLGVAWWNLKNLKLLERAHYPVTDAQEEWANELMLLDQLVVEGLSRSYFLIKAEGLGIGVNLQWGSLKLIGEVLLQQQVNDDEFNAVVTPLKSLHDLRSKMKGHASGSEAKAIRDLLIIEHGNLKSHYRALAADCDRAMALMIEFADKGVF
jgi:hypothetical protein